MPQTVTIRSLPRDFELVKGMRAQGLEWGEGYRGLGRAAIAAILAGQMAARSVRVRPGAANSGDDRPPRRRMLGELVVFAQEGRQLERLEMMGEQQLRRIAYDAAPASRSR